MFEYIYDFLSILFDKLKEKEKVRNIILFGSFARGNQRKDSDIDLFIDVEETIKQQVNEIVKEALNEFELHIENKWKIKGITNSITPIVDDLNNPRWNELKQEINSYGITLYGKYQGKKTSDKLFVLIEYDISKLKQKDKMKVVRKLHGYKLRKGKKIYTQEGLASKLKAEKISSGIIVDIENYKKISDLLRGSKIPIKLREIWLK